MHRKTGFLQKKNAPGGERFWIFTVLVIWTIFFLSLPGYASPGTEYSVRYGEIRDSKFINTYRKWNTTGEEEQIIPTPKVADRNGKRCFWKIRGNNGETGIIQTGDSFVLHGNARLTQIWKKLYRIRLFKYNGEKEHKDKTITLTKGERFYLPSITPHISKTFMGWSKRKNRTEADYNCTTCYTMVRDLDLYEVVVPRKKVSVHFWTQAAGSEFKNLTVNTYDGETVRMPKLSNNSTYTFLGWSDRVSQTKPQYQYGQSVKVRKNLVLYAVFVMNNGPRVYLKTVDGKDYKTVVPDGKTARFPSVYLGKTRTLQGWSKTKGKTCAPEYAESQLIPEKAGTYYMVVAKTPSDNTPAASRINLIESSKYKKVYFVGDSRMEHARRQFGSGLKKTKFISKSSQGYAWLAGKNTGYAQLVRAIKADTGNLKAKKAVIFCLGVNDLANIDRYISFYKAKAKELKSLGCSLFVMSVNPFCVGQLQTYKREFRHDPSIIEKRTQDLRKTFNAKLRKELDGIYQYLDVYSYLKKTGWPTTQLGGIWADGIHYTLDTNKRIINYASALIDR